MSLFPELDPVVPKLPPARWVRLVATLDHQGHVVAAQVDATAVDGTVILGRGFWPVTGATGDLEPLRTMLRFAQELTMD